MLNDLLSVFAEILFHYIAIKYLRNTQDMLLDKTATLSRVIICPFSFVITMLCIISRLRLHSDVALKFEVGCLSK